MTAAQPEPMPPPEEAGISHPGTRRYRPAELVLGLQGLALLRGFLNGSQEAVDARLAELAELLQTRANSPLWEVIKAPELDYHAGYAVWSETYDGAPNPIISLDERTVFPLIDRATAGSALDAACGTGRHVRYLHDLGHRVIGVDASPQMLLRARRKVIGPSFVLGGLEALPFRDAMFDLVVCALALTHCKDLTTSIYELARVVRPGGRLILSDVHPLLILTLSGHVALFRDVDGNRAFVRNVPHLHSAYLSAFASAGVQVRACLEEPYSEVEAAMMLPSGTPASARDVLVGLPSLLVWDLVRQ